MWISGFLKREEALFFFERRGSKIAETGSVQKKMLKHIVVG